MKLTDVTIGYALKRVEQRVLDIMIEKYLLDREVIEGYLKHLPKVHKGVSFVEPLVFDKQGYRFDNSRIVPYYTRAIEPIKHTLIPFMTEKGYSVVITHNPKFVAVNVYEGSNQVSLANAIHEKETVATVIACLKTLNLDEGVPSLIESRIKK